MREKPIIYKSLTLFLSSLLINSECAAPIMVPNPANNPKKIKTGNKGNCFKMAIKMFLNMIYK